MFGNVHIFGQLESGNKHKRPSVGWQFSNSAGAATIDCFGRCKKVSPIMSLSCIVEKCALLVNLLDVDWFPIDYTKFSVRHEAIIREQGSSFISY